MIKTPVFPRRAIALALVPIFMPVSALAATISVDDTCSLREAIISANNDSQENGCEQGNGADTIVLEANSTIELTEVDALGGGDSGTPLINSDITIQGNGSTLTRENSAPDLRLLDVRAGGSLTADSLTLTNGKGRRGSAIYAFQANTLVLSNSVVSGNIPGSRYDVRMGVYARDTDVYVKDSQVTNNSARIAAGLSVSSGALRMVNVDVTSNTAGLIAGVYVSEGSLYMQDSTVSGNSCSGAACGVRLYRPDAPITIIDSEISNNSAANNSSGLDIFGETRAEVSLSNTTISGNTATSRAGLSMYTYSHTLTNSQLTVTDSEISDNVATSNSGGVSGVFVYGKDDFLLENSTVSGNRADGIAGIVLMGNGYLPSITLRNSDITANTDINDDVATSSNLNRAGVYVDAAATVLLDDVRITDNRAVRSSAVYSKSSNLTMTGVAVRNNYSVGTAYAPVHMMDSSITLTQSTLANNSSSQGHGGILVEGPTSNVSILNSTMSGNQSPALEGSALQVNAATSVELANSTVSGNSGIGAAVVVSSAISVSLTNTTIANNQYAGGAGGIQVVSNPITFTINNTVIADNSNTDCASTLAFTGSNNWFQDASCTGSAQGAAGLEALADNGGSTLTHALSTSSPLINAGNTAICNASPVLGLDQRGEARNGGCDIGAYEFPDASSFFVLPTRNGKSVIIEL